MNDKQTALVFKALINGQASRLELAELSGANPKSVGRLLTEMKAQNLIYVIDYSNGHDGRNRVKIYTVGEGEDAKPQRSKSQEERSRKSYAKKMKIKMASRIKTTFVGGQSLWQ